jgi:hypothetical protein
MDILTESVGILGIELQIWILALPIVMIVAALLGSYMARGMDR